MKNWRIEQENGYMIQLDNWPPDDRNIAGDGMVNLIFVCICEKPCELIF